MPVSIEVALLKIENENIKLALGGNAGVELPEGPCRRVAGICKQGHSLALALFIDFVKGCTAKIPKQVF